MVELNRLYGRVSVRDQLPRRLPFQELRLQLYAYLYDIGKEDFVASPSRVKECYALVGYYESPRPIFLHPILTVTILTVCYHHGWESCLQYHSAPQSLVSDASSGNNRLA